MSGWENANSREVLKFVKSTVSTLLSASRGVSGAGAALVTGVMEAGMAAYNISIAEGYMDNYIAHLRQLVHEQSEKLMEMAGVTKELAKVSPEIVKEWLAALEKEGVIVGTKPYQVRSGELKEGVHPDVAFARAGMLRVTTEVLRRSEAMVKEHPLYKFGSRLIEAAHGVSDEAEIATWTSALTAGMSGELNKGIGAQTASMMETVAVSGFSLFASAVSDGMDEQRMDELNAKGELTKEERDELATLKGAEFSRLEHQEAKGILPLSKADKAKLEEYRARDQAARQQAYQASVKDMHQLTEKLVKKKELTDEEVKRYEEYRKDKNLASMRQQMEVELRNADAEQAAAEGRAKDAAIAAQKAAERQAEQNRLKHRDPEPGSLPAVASGKAPVGVDSLSAVEVLEDLANYFNTPEVKEVMDGQKSKKPLTADTTGENTVRAIPTVVGSAGAVPMSGFNPTLVAPALGNPVAAAGAAGVAVMLGMDYRTQQREVDMAYEGWRKGDASLLPDIVWSQPAAREMMERQMGYPFGRPELKGSSSAVNIESALPTRAPQACGGIEIPTQRKPEPISTPVHNPAPVHVVTPMPEQRRPEPMVTPIQQPAVQTPEGFDIHRPTLEDLIKYKKVESVSEEYAPTYKNGVYVPAQYHVHQRPGKSPAPVNGQELLDKAIKVGDRFIAVTQNGEVVIFNIELEKEDGQPADVYHGYVTNYKDVLTRHDDIKKALENKGYFTKKGRFIKGSE
jgi:hypothetical protein